MNFVSLSRHEGHTFVRSAKSLCSPQFLTVAQAPSLMRAPPHPWKLLLPYEASSLVTSATPAPLSLLRPLLPNSLPVFLPPCSLCLHGLAQGSCSGPAFADPRCPSKGTRLEPGSASRRAVPCGCSVERTHTSKHRHSRSFPTP